MKATVFYSWQSDTPANTGRELVRQCLEAAIDRLQQDAELVVRPELDHDTLGVPGAPPLIETILRKIDAATVFVADVTLTFSRRLPGPDRASPNPNVLIELGYGLKRLGHQRVILLQDGSLGGPETLPFDLRGSRVLVYDSANATSLTSELERAISLVLKSAGPPPDLLPQAVIELKRQDRSIESARHEYRLPVKVSNVGEDVIADWAIELLFPRAMLNTGLTYPIVRESNDGLVVMRQTEKGHSGPLFPGDSKEVLGIDYHMDDALYDKRATLFKREVVATFYAAGKRIARAVALVKDLQKY